MYKSKEVLLTSAFLTAMAGAASAQDVMVTPADGVRTDSPRLHGHGGGAHGSLYNFFHHGHHHSSGGSPMPAAPAEPTRPSGNTSKNGFGNSMRSTSGHS